MDHHDHVNLLRGGIPTPGGIWADLGSGSGAFTLALAELAGVEAEIYSIDQDKGALQEQSRAFKTRFPQANVHFQQADFTKRLSLPPLDGIVMANSLHFHRQKEPILKLLYDYLKPGGRLLMVEYNVDQGNMWVPHPLSFDTWKTLAKNNGFTDTQFLAARPSRFLKEIYSAVSLK
jgi:ubiquinone/menaquinone biosynthesis C-methylase UbiE